MPNEPRCDVCSGVLPNDPQPYWPKGGSPYRRHHAGECIASLQAERDKLRALMEEFTSAAYAIHDDEDGYSRCVLCGSEAYVTKNINHSDDCAWVKLRALVGAPK
jgi:hypothetical protein